MELVLTLRASYLQLRMELTASNSNWLKPSVAPGNIIVWHPPVSCGCMHLHWIQPHPQIKVIFPYLRLDAPVIYTGASLDWWLGRGSICNNGTLSGTITPVQSGPGSNGNKGVLCIPQISRTCASLSDCQVLDPGHSFGGGGSYLSAEMLSVYSKASADRVF